MRGKDLLECIEHIDDALIQEALEPTAVPRRSSFAVRWGMAAACTVVAGVSAAVFWSHQNLKNAPPVEHAEIAQIATNIANDSDTVDSAALKNDLTAGAVVESAQADVEAAHEKATANNDTVSGSTENAIRSSGADAAVSRDDTVAGMEQHQELKELGALTAVESAKPEYTIIRKHYSGEDDSAADSLLQKNSAEDCPMPGKGTVLRQQELQETIKYYETAADSADGVVYAYEVVIALYGDVAADGGILYKELSLHSDIPDGAELIEQEYLRLSELGYEVRLSEDFQMTGIFTKEEMDAFPTSPEYGYLLGFVDD